MSVEYRCLTCDATGQPEARACLASGHLVQEWGDGWEPLGRAAHRGSEQVTRPHYDCGVIAPCDQCGESDVLIATERDYLDVVTEQSCQACVEGWDEDC